MADTPRISLLDIPPELRLRIYDFVLQPLLEVPEHYDSYVLPDEWPQKSFSTYHSLMLSCKTISQELWPHFEHHYLRNITVFFDDTRPAMRFVGDLSRSRHREALGDLHISIRTLNWPRSADAESYAITTFRWSVDMVAIFTDLATAEFNVTKRSLIYAMLHNRATLPDPRSGMSVITAGTPTGSSSQVIVRWFADDGTPVSWTSYGEARADAKHIDWREETPMSLCDASRLGEANEALRDLLKFAGKETPSSDSEQRQSGEAGEGSGEAGEGSGEAGGGSGKAGEGSGEGEGSGDWSTE